MKQLAYLFVFLLLVTSVSAICYNHNDNPFCSKDDPTCAVEDEADNDGDGWSNSCDAFPENGHLWVDYDGDNIGYGTQVHDCDDLDATVQTFCGATDLLEAQNSEDSNENVDDDFNSEDNSNDNSEEETTEESDDESTVEESSQTVPTLAEKPRAKKNGGVTIYPPQDDDLVEEEVIVAAEDDEEEQETFVEREVVPLVDPTPVNEPQGNQITGAVTGTDELIVWWPFGILIAGIFFLFFLARRRKRD